VLRVNFRGSIIFGKIKILPNIEEGKGAREGTLHIIGAHFSKLEVVRHFYKNTGGIGK